MTLEDRLRRVSKLEERRRHARRRTLKSGKIIFDRSSMSCTISNLSDKGARLQLPSTQGLPGHFNLLIEVKGVNRICRVAWITETKLGVTFLS
jgi:hypothetical protein